MQSRPGRAKGERAERLHRPGRSGVSSDGARTQAPAGDRSAYEAFEEVAEPSGNSHDSTTDGPGDLNGAVGPVGDPEDQERDRAPSEELPGAGTFERHLLAECGGDGFERDAERAEHHDQDGRDSAADDECDDVLSKLQGVASLWWERPEPLAVCQSCRGKL